jgi:hypothetical protein
VPIRGEAGIGYALDRDFDMPPLMLTPDELEAAVLGAQWVADRGDVVQARAAPAGCALESSEHDGNATWSQSAVFGCPSRPLSLTKRVSEVGGTGYSRRRGRDRWRTRIECLIGWSLRQCSFQQMESWR